MSLLGQTRKSGDAITTSVLPSTADIPDSGCDVRKVPCTDSATVLNLLLTGSWFVFDRFSL